jgi:hypothetical protein
MMNCPQKNRGKNQNIFCIHRGIVVIEIILRSILLIVYHDLVISNQLTDTLPKVINNFQIATIEND